MNVFWRMLCAWFFISFEQLLIEWWKLIVCLGGCIAASIQEYYQAWGIGTSYEFLCDLTASMNSNLEIKTFTRLFSGFFKPRSETDTEIFIFSRLRPRLKYSYFRDWDLDESQNRNSTRPRLSIIVTYFILYGEYCTISCCMRYCIGLHEQLIYRLMD